MKLPVISVNGTEHICADNAGLDDDPVFLQCEITKLQIACHSVKSQFAHQTFFIFYQNIDHHRSYPGNSRLILYFAGGRLTWLGRLPGDIRVERENFKLYFR